MGANAYFIKLGAGDRMIDNDERQSVPFAQYCIDKGMAYFGFGSDGFLNEIQSHDYENFYNFHKKGRSGISAGVASRIKTAAKLFVESDENDYWFTFLNGDFYWTILEGQIETIPFADGIWRRAKGGWSNKPIGKQERLRRTTIPGSVAKIAGFRGTICSANDATQSVLNVIHGVISPGAAKAIEARPKFDEGLLSAIQELRDKDFEILVDLIVSNQGWQRIGAIGGVEKFTDGEYRIPILDIDVSVQTKTMTNFEEFNNYLTDSKKTVDEGAFFIYFFNFSKDQDRIYSEAEKSGNVRVIGPRELPQLVLAAGLFDWVVEHAR